MPTALFPAARYRFEFIAETPIRLPEYAGSALRGVFGSALKRAACMTRQKDCPTCPLYRTCPYPAIFEPPAPKRHDLQKFSAIPAPFVVEPPSWGERHYQPGDVLRFHFVLIGRALEQLPLVIYAWQRALQRGLGQDNGRAHLKRVIAIDQHDREEEIYPGEDGQIRRHPQEIELTDEPLASADCTLRFHTPLRLQRQGQPLRPEEITVRSLAANLLRRISLLSEFHAGRPLDIDFREQIARAEAIQSEKHLEWRDWSRYSNRQQQEMKLGGCVGEWVLHKPDQEFKRYLRLGQWTHIGKNASFGLGAYRVEA